MQIKYRGKLYDIINNEYVKLPINSKSGVVGYLKINYQDVGLLKDRSISLDSDKYPRIRLGRKLFRVHKLVYHHYFPNLPKRNQNNEKMTVNHINSDKNDVRLSNLEYITSRENTILGKLHTGNFVGVYWEKSVKKWRAQINPINGKTKYLGQFNSELDAARAYDIEAKSIGVKTNEDYGKYTLYFRNKSKEWFNR